MQYQIKHINSKKVNALLAPEKELYRPCISLKKIFLFLFVFFTVLFLLSSFSFYVSAYANLDTISFFRIFIFFLSIGLILFSTELCIFCIRLYQRFAPASTRLKCCCTPSCSQYAIIALQKYGLLFGIYKGYCHYKQCKPPGIKEFP